MLGLPLRTSVPETSAFPPSPQTTQPSASDLGLELSFYSIFSSPPPRTFPFGMCKLNFPFFGKGILT